MEGLSVAAIVFIVLVVVVLFFSTQNCTARL